MALFVKQTFAINIIVINLRVIAMTQTSNNILFAMLWLKKNRTSLIRSTTSTPKHQIEVFTDSVCRRIEKYLFIYFEYVTDIFIKPKIIAPIILPFIPYGRVIGAIILLLYMY